MNSKSEKESILTVPEEITPTEELYLTGNEYVSLPWIEPGGGITSANILHLGHKGLLEFGGSEADPLLAPLLSINDETVTLIGNLKWHYAHDWIPTFTAEIESAFKLEGEIVAPPGVKGFYYRLAFYNNSSSETTIRIGWQGCWKDFNYVVFNRREIEGKRSLKFNNWTRSLILEAFNGLPLAAAALAVEPEAEWDYDEKTGRFCVFKEVSLKKGSSYEVRLFAAFNLEGDGAGTTAIDMRRHGEKALKEETANWLEARRIKEEFSPLASLLNRNLFFSYFYALGRSLDSEELVPITSRSPRYYVSAAFWSRDALLWSFPAIMIADQDIARELLLTVFKRHLANAGDHAHYINGTVLYPGFELDQLAAFFLALEHYLKQSEDYSLFRELMVREGLETLVGKAMEQFDPESGLYSTFLDPSDDPVSFPFLTYNNALLQRSFKFLSYLQREEHWQHKADFATLATELQQAIYEHCTVKGPYGMIFAWAVDGRGKFALYDNPPGSLQLLAHYSFCSYDDTVFLNTARWIRSSNNKYYHQGSNFEEAGSLHAGNPWPLSACNDLLACNVGAVDFFRRAEMDNGFFCETVDPKTGKLSTGAAFASAAGFMAYALKFMRPESSCYIEK